MKVPDMSSKSPDELRAENARLTEERDQAIREGEETADRIVGLIEQKTRIRAELAQSQQDVGRWSLGYAKTIVERDEARALIAHGTLANIAAALAERTAERDEALALQGLVRDTVVRNLTEQRDQALRLLINCAAHYEAEPYAFEAWALRASDPTKPWPSDQETQDILNGK